MTDIIQPSAEPKRFQCRHIFTDGRRCGSPALRHEELCYYHHTSRKPVRNPDDRRGRRSAFSIPAPEDRSAIQLSIGEVLSRIASNDIDPRRAGLLLYGLQIASLNLPKAAPAAAEQGTSVEEIVADPALGTLAPRAELPSPGAPRENSLIARLLEELRNNPADSATDGGLTRNEAAERKPLNSPAAPSSRAGSERVGSGAPHTPDPAAPELTNHPTNNSASPHHPPHNPS